MPEHLIEGVTVEFPFEPYDLQRAYMGKVINCLDKSENAVLESPTGNCLNCEIMYINIYYFPYYFVCRNW